MGLFHTKVVTTPDDGASEVGTDEWNEEHIADEDGLRFETSGSVPSVPAAGFIKLFGSDVAGKKYPAFVNPSGFYSTLQPFLGRKAVMSYKGQCGSTSISSGHGLSIAAVGTTTAATWANTTLHTQLNRISFRVTAASSSAVAGFRSSNLMVWRGNAANRGGFLCVIRWGPDTGAGVTTHRAFCGIRATSGSATDSSVSTLLNTFGMGWDSGDTNISFYANGNPGTSKVDTGIPIGTNDSENVYEVAIFCAPNDSEMSVFITDLNTDNSYTQTVTDSNLLINNTLGIAPHGWCSVGGTSSVIGFSLMNCYIETDM